MPKIFKALLIVKSVVEFFLPHLQNYRAKKTLTHLARGIEAVSQYADRTRLVSGKDVKRLIASHMINHKRSSKFLDRCLVKLGLKKK